MAETSFSQVVIVDVCDTHKHDCDTCLLSSLVGDTHIFSPFIFHLQRSFGFVFKKIRITQTKHKPKRISQIKARIFVSPEEPCSSVLFISKLNSVTEFS